MPLFVVEIDLDDSEADCKVFQRLDDARSRFRSALGSWLSDDEMTLDDKPAMPVNSCRLYEVDTDDVRQARDLALAGRGTLVDDLTHYAEQKHEQTAGATVGMAMARPATPHNPYGQRGQGLVLGVVIGAVFAAVSALIAGLFFVR